MTTWQWQGQLQADWPTWLVAKNIARSSGRITVHSLDGDVVIELGDWVMLHPDGRISVRKPEPSWDERQFRSILQSF